MKQETLSDALLRKFLLGKVNDEERVQIESLFLVHPEAKQRVLDAAQDLIEDYLENSLTPADIEIFLSTYARTAEQRQRLRIVKSIKRAAAGEELPNLAGRGFLERLLWRSVLVPISVTVAIALVIAVVWLNSRTRQERVAVEQELAQLNASACLLEVPPQMGSLDLSPVTLRSAERQFRLRTGAGVQIVELRLSWIQREPFSAYEAEIRRLGDGETFTIRIVAATGDGRYAARIRLPAHILRVGQYQIRVTGFAASGETGPAEDYQFIVAD